MVSDASRQVVVSWVPSHRKGPTTISVPGRPTSVAYGWNKYYVGNESTQTVDVVNKKGRLLYTLGNDFLIQRPSDIALAVDQQLVFVTDPMNSRVLVFDADGAFLGPFPAEGQAPLYMPTGIAVDPVRGEVLVSDFGLDGGNAQIKIYDLAGMFLTSINGNVGCGSFGCNTTDRNFSRPQGLSVNEQGYIYLADSVRSQVLVFDRETKQSIDVIGIQGTAPGELMLPLDVLIDPQSKDLYVTSNRTQRVEVFNGKGWQP